MKACKRLSALIILFQPFFIAHADEGRFPNDLIYKNKPIDALCLYEAKTKFGLVSLSTCGIHSIPGRKMIRPDNDLMNNGFVGYEYIQTRDAYKDQQPHSYSYYKVLGKQDKQYVISAFNNIGEKEEVTSLYLLKRDQDQIKVTRLMAGDRCNGGISDVQLLGQRLVFTVDISPFDFLTMAKLNPHHLSPHIDLDSCSACCAGKANYLIDLNKDKAIPTLLSVDLGKDTPMVIANSRYQPCFNKLIITSQKQWLRFLDPKKLRTFVKRFNTECVTKAGHRTNRSLEVLPPGKGFSMNTLHHQHPTSIV